MKKARKPSVIVMGKRSRKPALLVGINTYPAGSALSGCVNDSKDWASYLKGFGYVPTLLLNRKATRAAIISSLKEMLKSLRPGDTGVFAYSGHGSWVPCTDGSERDRRSECICPVDCIGDESKIILDDEIAALLSSRAKGSRVLMMSDSCHSGTVYRSKPKIIYSNGKGRFLHPSLFCDRPGASRISKPPRRESSSEALPGVIFFSGCGDNQYSADASFGGRSNGAFTYYALGVFKKLGPDSTYAQIYKELRNYLPSSRYEQKPEMHALPEDAGRKIFT